LDGIKQWYFSVAVEALPLMLQTALLLFGCAISRYLWTINHIVAAVNLAFTVLGVLAYIALVLVAIFLYACPYQTPLSIAMRYVLDLDSKHTKYIPHFTQFVQSLSRKLVVDMNRLYAGFKRSHMPRLARKRNYPYITPTRYPTPI
jgi:hypothetical protein